jgi:acetyl esterase/lipase
LGGDSTGGGLMLALLAHLVARNQVPRAAFATSPWVDLTLCGHSLETKTEVLLPVSRMNEVVDRYLCGQTVPTRARPRFLPRWIMRLRY